MRKKKLWWWWYLEVADDKEDEAVGADASVEGLEQAPRGEELFEHEAQVLQLWISGHHLLQGI